jgi:acyl carrier protein
MTRDEIVGLIRKQAVATVPSLDAAKVDFSRSLRDQGASSLDVVELVSALMRQLRVKVPRAQLAKISTLDGLADLFVSALAENTKSAVH